MPLLTPVLPAVDAEEFGRLPLRERLKITSTFWADNGFGTPRYVHIVYLLKVVAYALGGVLIVSLTSGVGTIGEFGRWWTEPIVYQKFVVWTVLVEVLGVGGAWGPLCGHFRPMTGGARYWLRTGTVRVAPWRRVPLTAGDRRTPVDVVLYAALVASLVLALVLPGRPAMLPWVAALPVVLLVLNGLRDSIVFLAARGEQYVPALVFSATLGHVDLIIAAKVLIVTVWLGAGVSKFGRHFVNVVPPMVSNAPFTPGTWVRRLHYRDAPRDLRPSRFAWFMAHVGGTTVEIIVPLVLLFTTNATVALLAAGVMVLFHLYITVSFPLAVPLEWNVLFGFLVLFLFVGHPAGDGFAVTDFSQPWLLILITCCLLFFPVLGNLRPDLVSFLPSMRQYAGNWASALWAFAPGAEEKLERLDLPVPDMTTQVQALLRYERPTAELSLSLVLGWRSMHSQGRGLLSVLFSRLDDIDERVVREGEFVGNFVRGWNFGDGHLHDERMIAAVQRRAGFAPGEVMVVFVESQPIHRGVQRYRVIDPAVGVVERGTWNVGDAVAQQPWLPDGPILLTVTWSHPDTEPADVAPSPP